MRTIETQPGRLATFSVGGALLAGSFFASGGDSFKGMALCLGAALVTAAGLTPWIESLTFGPHGLRYVAWEKRLS